MFSGGTPSKSSTFCSIFWKNQALFARFFWKNRALFARFLGKNRALSFERKSSTFVEFCSEQNRALLLEKHLALFSKQNGALFLETKSNTFVRKKIVLCKMWPLIIETFSWQLSNNFHKYESSYILHQVLYIALVTS